LGSLVAALLAGAASAQIMAPSQDQVPLTNLLEILLFERELVAIDAEGGGQTTAKLRLGERTVWSGTRGKVGVVLTDQRILAVGVDSAAWQSTEYQRGESRPDGAMLGDRVALIVTNRRAIGFNGGSGNLVEYRFGPNEKLLSTRIGENVGIVVTDRKALGLSPSAGGFFETRLQLREEIRSVETRSNLATITTNRRVLIFRAPSGSWSERKLDLNS
jgi:hypothetical protein